MESVTLATSRLVLRAPSEADIEAITAACQDPEIPRWTPLPSPYSRADAAGYVRAIADAWADESQAIWCLYREGTLIGAVGLHRIQDHPSGGEAEIGYWLAALARGNGYLVEAAQAVIDWAFENLGLARIGWRATVGNVASARTARALGFQYEGMLRQGLTGPRGRDDGWVASLLAGDDRTPTPWPML